MAEANGAPAPKEETLREGYAQACANFRATMAMRLALLSLALVASGSLLYPAVESFGSNEVRIGLRAFVAAAMAWIFSVLDKVPAAAAGAFCSEAEDLATRLGLGESSSTAMHGLQAVLGEIHQSFWRSLAIFGLALLVVEYVFRRAPTTL